MIQNKRTECEPLQFGSSRERIGGLQASDPLQAGHIYMLLKIINATANGKTRVIQNKRTECEPSQFGSRERIGGLQASDPLHAGYIYMLLNVINATANEKIRVIQNKRTECKPSKFDSSRERIAAANAEICNATQQRMLSGQPVQTHL